MLKFNNQIKSIKFFHNYYDNIFCCFNLRNKEQKYFSYKSQDRMFHRKKWIEIWIFKLLWRVKPLVIVGSFKYSITHGLCSHVLWTIYYNRTLNFLLFGRVNADKSFTQDFGVAFPWHWSHPPPPPPPPPPPWPTPVDRCKLYSLHIQAKFSIRLPSERPLCSTTFHMNYWAF